MPDFTATTITLFLIMDPIGNSPLFLSILKDTTPKRRLYIIARESLFAYILLNIFLVFGNRILDVLNLRQESVNVAGGVILFIIALQLLFVDSQHKLRRRQEPEPFLVPLAIPLIAGPAVLATLILMRGSSGADLFWLFVSMSVAWLGSTCILICAPAIGKVLRPAGMQALEKLMAIVLLVLATQSILDGITAFFGVGL